MNKDPEVGKWYKLKDACDDAFEERCEEYLSQGHRNGQSSFQQKSLFHLLFWTKCFLRSARGLFWILNFENAIALHLLQWEAIVENLNK